MYSEAFIFYTHRKVSMKYIVCIVFGMVLATVGFSGLAKMFDRGVDTIKTQSQEMAK